KDGEGHQYDGDREEQLAPGDQPETVAAVDAVGQVAEGPREVPHPIGRVENGRIDRPDEADSGEGSRPGPSSIDVLPGPPHPAPDQATRMGLRDPPERLRHRPPERHLPGQGPEDVRAVATKEQPIDRPDVPGERLEE